MDQTDNFDIAVPDWTTTHERNKGLLHQWCDLAAGLETIRGQWKASIVVTLAETPIGVPELQKRLVPANRRVLVRALRELEAAELIVRNQTSGVGYSLTSQGMALAGILLDLAAWHKARNGYVANFSSG
ncbi:helix-turn-helix transcriptional regulator [Ochrobactrum sp. Q0168]|uniref:winged helix-turn-helix transcriptional regulator n=1 Tax=Ochrobactrum sp. Q0168 TaxID=2793241 RepID=UPI0018EAE277|nr:helix-turn-helix transcriptional regulator [Ochrobactrum sp. Q0168]